MAPVQQALLEATHRLIEVCMRFYLTESEIAQLLQAQHHIDPGLTGAVWLDLQQRNPDFFRAYHLRVVIKDQVNRLNRLTALVHHNVPAPRLPVVATGYGDACGCFYASSAVPAPSSGTGHPD
eukprot:TRINITY_DN262_c0_g1_i4.p2 TRINITY_DN262_c0_g1~~TRINITY_DN262_c0_g1_i4.p2  ORF type:complete len:123 (+),score=38.89 TRINITY_DN262_c0_g1_i4:390-758(+)